MIYAIGKGPTSATVSAPDIGVDFGRSVTIKGTVKDVSPGTQDEKIKLRFPNGVAAVSEDTMSDGCYMSTAIHKTHRRHRRPVSINVLDANGNYRTIGTTTTDTQGFFTYSWTPDIPGEYKSLRRLRRQQSILWISSRKFIHCRATAFTDTISQPAAALPPFELYIVGLAIVFIVAIAVQTLLIIRKRP
jgi:hypothetical protein